MKTELNDETVKKSEEKPAEKARLPRWATILIFVLALALSVLVLDLGRQRLGWFSFGADTPVASDAEVSNAAISDQANAAETTDATEPAGNAAAVNSGADATQSTDHGDFGTKAVFVSPEASARSGLPVGFWLLEVLESRSAYQAGIRRNDVVLQLDEVEAIGNYGNDIIAYRNSLQVGDVVRVEYWDYDTGEIRSVDVECTPSDGLYWMNEQSVIDAIFPPATQTSAPAKTSAPTQPPSITGVQILMSDIVKVYQTPKWESRFTISNLVTNNDEWAAVGIADNPSQVAGTYGEYTLSNQENNQYYLTFNGTKSFDLVTYVGSRREETHWTTNLVRDDMIRAFNEEWGWGIRIYRGADRNLYMCYFSSEYEGKDITDFVVFICG